MFVYACVCGYNNSENSLQVMEEMHRSEQVCNTKFAIAKTPWQAETVSKSKSQVLRSSLTETQKRCQVPFRLHMHSEVTNFRDLEFGSIIFLVVFRFFSNNFHMPSYVIMCHPACCQQHIKLSAMGVGLHISYSWQVTFVLASISLEST